MSDINSEELSRLEVALISAWSKETSSDSQNWFPENGAWGQCAVTALIVNDYFCGKIVWANVTLIDGRNISHYFNYINGVEVDLTRRQFPSGAVIPAGVDKTKGFSTTREYVLSYQPTKERYELLKERVKNALQ